MENEELELAALEAELAALEAEEASVIVEPTPPKPRKKKAAKLVSKPVSKPEPVVEVAVDPVRINKTKSVRPLRPQGGDRQRGIRYRN